MLADSSDIDAAIFAALSADAELSALMPDGFWYDVAKRGATRFVLVSMLSHEDQRVFGDRGFEVVLYLVKAVALGKSPVDAIGAAKRIDAVLEGAQLSATGYHWMNCQRVERVRIEEFDDLSDATWQHVGGHYEVWVQPINNAAERKGIDHANSRQ